MKFDIQNDGGQNSFHTSLFKDLIFFPCHRSVIDTIYGSLFPHRI